MDQIRFGVLGPVTAWRDGEPLDLKGPRHRAVLARLIVARRRMVPVAHLVEDLWDDPPPGAVGAVQTFVGALRRVLEPDRPRRTPARLLVTAGPGYALRPDMVDAWEFEALVDTDPARALELWRGPAYAEFQHEPWTRTERTRLAELRLRAVERHAEARLAQGAAAEAVPDLDAHVMEHPWREDAWRLLALALYQSGRQADALAVLGRARSMLADQLGLDPSPRLQRLQQDILAQDPQLTPASRLWTRAAEVYDRTVAAGSRVRLESTVGLLRGLAVTGATGLQAAQEHRLAAIEAAEEFGDPALTARVVGAYDVPAIWTRSDDPEQAHRIVAVAERTLSLLPADPAYDAARCRLLATVALDTRGSRDQRGPEAARQAEEIARRLRDPALLAFALNGKFMQSCTRAGLAPRRDEIGAELIDLAGRHGMITYEVLGHLIRLQARSALADFDTADKHATTADRLATQHELPLVGFFTQWYRALRRAATGHLTEASDAYHKALSTLDGCGMPGVATGLAPLVQLCRTEAEDIDPDADWGPYRPWIEPLVLPHNEARDALHALPEPPADLLYELLLCLEVLAAQRLQDQTRLDQLAVRLQPAAAELAGAGSGLVTLGPIADYLHRCRRPGPAT